MWPFIFDGFFEKPKKLLHMFATWLKKKTCEHRIEKVAETWLVQDIRMRICEDCGETDVCDPFYRQDHGYKILKNYDPKYQHAA